jgi:ribosomal protein L11 methylase PrmA
MTDTRRRALLDHLRRTVAGLSVDPRDTTWADYAGDTSYSADGTRSKEAAARNLLAKVHPEAAGHTVVDIGANTGRYSALAEEVGYRVIAVDGDWAAVERHYRDVRARASTNVLPLLGDIAAPAPGIGWANREREPLLDRLRGDVVLGLALIHHLAIGRNIPLLHVADLMAGLAPHLVIEWVPKEDPMVQRLLAAREDVFADYHEAGFRAAFGARFAFVDEIPVADSSRRIFLFRRH